MGRIRTFALLAAGLLAGCSSGPKLAKVSGVVKLNGKPYPNALVSFQPVGGKNNPNPGRGSMGQTDADGHFALLYDGTVEGALVGPHTVRITTLPGKGVHEPPAPAEGSPDGVPRPTGIKSNELDPIPLEWNERSKQAFTVPPEGTDQANFDITTRGGKK